MYGIKRVVVVLIYVLCVSLGFAVPNFTFVHISDTHAPGEQSKQTISLLKDFGKVQLGPYGIQSQKPEFIIVTGDMTEFGEEGWSAYEEFWQGIKIPRYDVLGNHDNTWSSLRDKLRANYGAPYYSFEHNGCHFIILESATVQDPLPSFGQEELNWLKDDLKKITPETPIFICFHHPLDSNEFASTFERYRLLELFQPYNLVCILVGHGHTAKYFNYEGYDCVEGGSSFGPNPGFNIMTISNNTLFVAYYNASDSTARKGLLQKSILKKIDYPNILISNPLENKPVAESSFEIKSIVYKFPGVPSEIQYQIDGGKLQPLTNSGSYYGSTVSTDELTNGVHYLQVIYSNSQATTYRTLRFVVEKPSGPMAHWRYNLLGSSKSNPMLDSGVIYVGGDDGRLYAIDTVTGKARWTYTTGGEILSTPVIVNQIIYFCSGDGNLYAVFTDGKIKWRFKADSPVYSSPCVKDGMVYFGSKKGTFYALRADDGIMKWKFTGAGYCIEDQPLVYNGTVYFTVWDSYVYAVDAKNGELKWRAHNAGSNLQTAKKYYSAGDSNPVVTKSNVWFYVSDRGWYLSAMNLETGILSWYTTDCLALSAAEDGESLYVRTFKGDGQLQKWSLDGKLIWTSPIQLNVTENGRALRYPAPAVEKNGKVYIVSCWGTLHCIDGKTGKPLWEYQVTPQLAVMSVPYVDSNGTVYVSAMDGTVTAVVGPK